MASRLAGALLLLLPFAAFLFNLFVPDASGAERNRILADLAPGPEKANDQHED